MYNYYYYFNFVNNFAYVQWCYTFKGTFQGIPDLNEMDKFTKSLNI